MKETMDEKAELVSPPRGIATWGDNSPFMTNPSPPASILQRSTPPLVIAGADQIEAKSIGDGFLSEVSTPDFVSKNLQDYPSSAESKKEDQATNYPPHRPLPAACEHPKHITDKSTSHEDAFLLSKDKTEEALGESRDFAEIPHCENAVEGERLLDAFTKPEMYRGAANPLHFDGPKSATSPLKRKRVAAIEEKTQKKRLRNGDTEKSKGKGSAQWSHLSEDELKKMRRVKNRESVEKCRTKQRLRMEALQVEQTCLRFENKNLREAVGLIHTAIHDVSVQVTKIKAHMQSHGEERNGMTKKEIKKEVQA